MVVGVGLIGGSLAWGVKRRGLATEVVGVDADPVSLGEALKAGMIDRSASLAEAAGEADLIVLAVPAARVAAVAKALAPHMAPATIVTDVGSVKRTIVEQVEALFPRFVGGHPMAGGERSGAAAASADLFMGSACLLTPTGRTDAKAVETVSALWRGLGASVTLMDPTVHDEVVAAVSHLPHLAAYALVNTVAGVRSGGGVLPFAAGGFRDLTRIAASSPEMWRDICLMNREPLLEMLRRYAEATGHLRDLIGRGDGEGLLREFSQARAVRTALPEGRG